MIVGEKDCVYFLRVVLMIKVFLKIELILFSVFFNVRLVLSFFLGLDSFLEKDVVL